MWRWIWTRKWRLLALFVALSIAGWLIWTETLRAEFEDRLQALRDAGHPVNVADLDDAPIPDEENAAVLYAEAAEMIGRRPDAIEDPDPEYLEPEDYKEAADWLESKSHVVALLHEAAERPSWAFDVGWADDNRDRWRTLLGLGWAANDLLMNYAEKKAREGDAHEALRCVETIFRFADHLPPACTSLYIRRVSTYSYAMGTLQRISVAPSFDPDPAEERLAPFLASAVAIEPFVGAVRGDLAHALRMSRDWIEGGSPIPAIREISLADVMGDEPKEPTNAQKTVEWLLSSWVLRPFAIQDGIYLIEDYEKAARLLGSASLADLENTAKPDRGLPYVFSTVAGVPLAYYAEQMRDLRAHVAVTRAGLDALIHRKKHGSFPDDLTGSPLDPFTGKPLLYERREDGTARIEAARPLPYEGASIEVVEEWEIVWELK
ncbi:MAG: hypothetical protein V3T86_14550 [Planctomycetota bacterium]